MKTIEYVILLLANLSILGLGVAIGMLAERTRKPKVPFAIATDKEMAQIMGKTGEVK